MNKKWLPLWIAGAILAYFFFFRRKAGAAGLPKSSGPVGFMAELAEPKEKVPKAKAPKDNTLLVAGIGLAARVLGSTIQSLLNSLGGAIGKAFGGGSKSGSGSKGPSSHTSGDTASFDDTNKYVWGLDPIEDAFRTDASFTGWDPGIPFGDEDSVRQTSRGDDETRYSFEGSGVSPNEAAWWPGVSHNPGSALGIDGSTDGAARNRYGQVITNPRGGTSGDTGPWGGGGDWINWDDWITGGGGASGGSGGGGDDGFNGGNTGNNTVGWG